MAALKITHNGSYVHVDIPQKALVEGWANSLDSQGGQYELSILPSDWPPGCHSVCKFF